MKMKTFLTALMVSSAAAFAPRSFSSTRMVSTTSLQLAVGEVAPDFSLKDQNGKVVTRSKIAKPLVVYFYPADATPGCTVQATSFNEQVKEIRKKYGADLVGISGQDVASKQKFAKELGLDFSILADDGDKVRKAFGVPRAAFGLLPGRVTYVLNKNGVCTAVFDDIADAKGHVEFATRALALVK